MAETTGGDVLEREDRDDVAVVRIKVPMLRGDDVTEDVFSRLYSLFERTECRKLVLNVGDVEYFASVALGKLVTLYHKVKAAEARLALCNVTPTVDRILQLTHLSDVLAVYADEREALRSLA